MIVIVIILSNHNSLVIYILIVIRYNNISQRIFNSTNTTQ
jgi:hypothetical protein